MFAAIVLFSSAAAMADANDGDLFGYALGDTYTETDDKPQDDARLVLIAAQNPVKPTGIETVYVLVTPISRTIGKVAGETWFASGEDAILAYERFRSILRKKYINWETEERSEQHLQAAQFQSGNYTLSVHASGPHRGSLVKSPDRPFQLVVALSYRPSVAAATDFESLANAEIKQVAADQFSEDEVQGL
jgi:hypothetical protein